MNSKIRGEKKGRKREELLSQKSRLNLSFANPAWNPCKISVRFSFSPSI